MEFLLTYVRMDTRKCYFIVYRNDMRVTDVDNNNDDDVYYIQVHQ